MKIDYNDINPQVDYFIFRYCTPEWIIINEITDFIDLTYILEGRGTYTIDGVKHTVEKGDLVCIPRGSLRYAVSDPNHHMLAYAANFQLTNREGQNVVLPFPVVSRLGRHEDIIQMYDAINVEWTTRSDGYGMKVRSLFLQILYQYFSLLYFKNAFSNYDPRIKKAIQYIIENYHNPITMEEVARLLKLSVVYTGNLFKNETGVPLKKYINIVRINNAETMLQSGEFSVKEVAKRCGFDNISYFSRTYKAMKGYMPSQGHKHPIKN